MQRKVTFTHSGHSHLAGNFQAGDTFTGDAEACRHFVEEARCAEWADAAPVSGAAPAGPASETVQTPARKSAGGKKAAAPAAT